MIDTIKRDLALEHIFQLVLAGDENGVRYSKEEAVELDGSMSIQTFHAIDRGLRDDIERRVANNIRSTRSLDDERLRQHKLEMATRVLDRVYTLIEEGVDILAEVLRTEKSGFVRDKVFNTLLDMSREGFDPKVKAQPTSDGRSQAVVPAQENEYRRMPLPEATSAVDEIIIVRRPARVMANAAPDVVDARSDVGTD